MVSDDQGVTKELDAGASAGRGGSLLHYVDRASRWSLCLWLVLPGAMSVGGGVFRVLRGDTSWATGAPGLLVGLLMLVAGIAVMRGSFFLAGLIIATLVATTLVSTYGGMRLLPAGSASSFWTILAELTLPLTALIWILIRRFVAGRWARGVSAGMGLLVVLLYLAGLPSTAAGLGRGAAMLVIQPPAPAKVAEGERMPDVQLRAADGEWIRPDAGGAVYVINFWATWCVPCRMELPELRRLGVELRRAGDIRVMAVNTEDLPADELAGFVMREGLEGLPVYAITDADKALIGVETIPMTLVVKNREILLRTEGYSPAAIEELGKLAVASLGGAPLRE